MSKALTLDEMAGALMSQLADTSPITIPPDPTPISDALLQLRGALTVQDCGVLGALPGVRTMGDLKTVLDRGEIVGELGEKLRGMLG